MRRFSWLRWNTGLLQLKQDQSIGRRAAELLHQRRPALTYTFTQVGLEALEESRRLGHPSVLESPNGHIRHFRDVYLE